jgi:hypothetical protein
MIAVVDLITSVIKDILKTLLNYRADRLIAKARKRKPLLIYDVQNRGEYAKHPGDHTPQHGDAIAKYNLGDRVFEIDVRGGQSIELPRSPRR